MRAHANSSMGRVDPNWYFLHESLWPAVLYTAVLMIVGTIGNTLVLVVYRRHFSRSVTRMFIYALAVLDLGNCLITMPAELTILIQFTSFPSPIWCKVTRYLTYIFNGTSSFVLIAIALDRYFKVCRPMKTLITVRRARIICIGSFILTAVVATPALIIYGELRLPLRVSSQRVSILPLSEISTEPSTSRVSLASPNHSAAPRNFDQKTTFNAYMARPNLKDFSSTVVHGQFCLLNSENINGTAPMIFYTGMFAMYIGMVVFLLFFYGKVAKAMFVLTSKHSKMTSFKINKACTPSSNSFVPEGNDEHGSCSKDKKETSPTGNRSKGSNNASKCCDSINEKRSKDYNCTTFQGQLVEGSNTGSAADSNQNANTAETGYATGETSSTSETRTQVPCKTEQISNNSAALTTDNDKGNCEAVRDNGLELPVNSEGSTRPQDSATPGTTSSSRNSSVNERNSKLSIKKTKNQKKSKIPKIKVQKNAKSDCHSNDSFLDLPDNAHHGTLLPLTANPLFSRRVSSVRTHAVHHPEGQPPRFIFPDINDIDNPRAAHKPSSRGNKQSCMATVNLAYLMGDDNPSLIQENMYTLTKMSFNGKSKRCVLPLRGLTTKTANQVRDQLTTDNGHALTMSVGCLDSLQPTGEEGMTKGQNLVSSDLCLPTSCRNDILPVTLTLTANRLSKSKSATSRSSPGQLNSPDLDSVVTLRNRTPEMVKSGTQLENGDKNRKCQVQILAPRKEVVSAAEILEEQHRRHTLHPFRTSRILFIISLVFVISFLPFFVIALTRSSIGSSFMSRSNLELGIINVFLRSSLISNAVNPIAYGLLSTHFRRECAGLFGCMSTHK